MKQKITAILITVIISALLTGCVQAATTANTNVEVLPEPKATSVFALSVTSTVAPVVTYVPEEISELQEDVAAITLPAEQSPLPENGEKEAAEEGEQTPEPENTGKPEATKKPEVTKKPETTKKPEATKKPEYTVTDVEDQEGYVYAKSVNLRSGPGTSYDVVREYDQYRELTVTGKSGDWYQVKVGSREGFMLKEYVKLGEVPRETPKPTAEPTPKPTATPEPEKTPEPAPEPTQPPVSDMPSSGSYTSDELYLLAQLVYKEGDGPSYVAVANVILNRINSSKFPNTVEGVVYQKSQFSTSNFKTPSSAAKEAVTAVFVNGQTVLPSNVYYFRTASSWSGHEQYGKIGGNYFYY